MKSYWKHTRLMTVHPLTASMCHVHWEGGVHGQKGAVSTEELKKEGRSTQRYFLMLVGRWG